MKTPDQVFENQLYSFLDVSLENVSKLAELRLEINHGRTLDELLVETEKYAIDPNRKAFVSMYGAVPTGFVQVKAREEDLPAGAPEVIGITELAHLARIAVKEEYRGKGIASGLLKQAEAWARAQGKKGIWLDYWAENDPASGLYEKAGYKDVAEFPDVKKENRIRRIAIKYFE